MFVRETESGAMLVTSASDLTAASMCEFAFLRRVDVKFGRDVVVPADDDPMLARAGALGDAHEERVLGELRADLGTGTVGAAGGVVEIPRPRDMSPAGIQEVADQTLVALHSQADVVFQATFFDPAQRPARPELGEPAIAFLGFADFLALQSDGSYEVQDTKLARKAKVTALMQLAAYAEQLERLGVPVSQRAALLLGSGERSEHRIADIAPVFRRRRERLHTLLLERYAAVGADGTRASAPAIGWGDPGVEACGRCEVCEPEVQRTRDPLLIAGVQGRQRDALVRAGLRTIDAVAAALPSAEAGAIHIDGISDAVLKRIVFQADVQVAPPEPAGPGQPARPRVRVADASALAVIPAPNDGDLFFDFEGDPFFRETGDDGVVRWNLDYLFGMVDTSEAFTPIWAHSIAEERAALERFVALVKERRERFPGMRIYHYAAYERTHLLSIAARHGVCEAEIDRLLSEHVLVDLYPIVRRALQVGSRSYSIKKLEPLYMGSELRAEDGVTNGAQSVVEFAEASAQLRSGDAADRAAGAERIEAIADYNRYDCVSTLRLRDWLLEIAREHGVVPLDAALFDAPASREVALSPVGAALTTLAEITPVGPERTALKLAASAIDYHQREQKSFWWAHFARLVDPIEDWADTRDVMVVDAAESDIAEDWFTPERARTERRIVRLRGTIAPGSSFKPGSRVFAVYELPAPFTHRGAPGARAAREVTVLERHGDGIMFEELLPADADHYTDLPVALTPGTPPPAGKQKDAIEEWGNRLATAVSGGFEFRDPVYELLLRSAPRLTDGGALVRPDSDEALAVGGSDDARTIGAVIASLRKLDRAALAVQGPPGTGKTYLAARVIRKLVEVDGWRIGVVAQSHKVVENVLSGVVSAGLDPARVAKVPQGGALDPEAQKPAYTVLRKDGHAAFLRDHSDGAVIGGTAWDFANEKRIERKSLDLLVIDEAGQFSLAPTIAAAAAADRILLLGDQQQLPQVSQGSHPEPVDEAALTWLLDGRGTMPEELGYFLAETRRMHPALASVVSELSYEGRLHAHPSAADREVLGGGAPGLHWVPVEHSGNATSSPEEAAAVARLAARLLTAQVVPGAGEQPRALTEHDIVVVAAYNAQVECVSEALAAVGLGRIRVGTVDRFQGQEAVFALVSLAASSAADVPRGLEFLLMRNRLNVGISRAQWAAYLVSADTLGDGLPTSPEGVAALSGYLRLTERGNVEAW